MPLDAPQLVLTIAAQLDDPSLPDSLTFEQTIMVALLSLLAGYAIALFRNRVLPWPTLNQFSEQVQRSDVVQVPPELSEASRRSWLTDQIQNETDRLGNVFAALRYSEAFLKVHRDGRAAIETTIDRLQRSSSDTETIAALYVAFSHEGLPDLLSAAIARSALAVPAHDTTQNGILVYQFVRDENAGCFQIDFPDELVTFGGNLNSNGIWYERLGRTCESISRLQTGQLVPMFEALLPLLQTQLDVHRKIAELAKPIVEPKARWAAHIAISNYGSTPFLVFESKGWILIEGKGLKPFCLPTKLVYVESNGEMDVVGAYVVESGKTVNFMLVSTATQSEIERGEQLRTLWKSGAGRGQVRFHVRGPELPTSLWATTRKVLFKEPNPDS